MRKLTRCVVLTYAVRCILIDSVQYLAHADVATAAMARHRTWNIVAGLGYFWAVTQLRGHYHPITAEDDNAVWLTGRHFITNTELTGLRPDHRSAAACAISMESNQVAYRCHIAHLNPVYVWKTATRLAIWQEALLPQTDRATRCVSRNAVNCCTTVGTSCTTNQSSGFRASHRRPCNKLCVSCHGTSTVDEFGRSSCHGEIFWSRIWDKILEVNISLFLEVPEFLYNAV